jgi:hypothetical protein
MDLFWLPSAFRPRTLCHAPKIVRDSSANTASSATTPMATEKGDREFETFKLPLEAPSRI